MDELKIHFTNPKFIEKNDVLLVEANKCFFSSIEINMYNIHLILINQFGHQLK